MRSAFVKITVLLAGSVLVLLMTCSRREKLERAPEMQAALDRGKALQVARLGLDPERPTGLPDLHEAFTTANPGYDLHWHPATKELAATETTRIVFVQGGKARGEVGGAGVESELVVGDLVVLRPGQSLSSDGPLDLLVFVVPEAPGAGVPAVIRPDWDPRITDTPGGCATDPGAYRRLLLTWDPTRGPYVYHKLNVHRIRADDSFTHYHPEQGGFDEFYLVQEAPPGSKFLFSYGRDLLKEPEKVTRAQAADLMRSRENMEPARAKELGQEDAVPGLLPGDLIYIPRGVLHRGLGGIVAQIIAVPGFVPGGEVPVDDEIQAVNEHLDLIGPQRIPCHEK